MTHEEALNKILASECPRNQDGDNRTFEIELCCARVRILATYRADISNPNKNDFRYDIHSVDVL